MSDQKYLELRNLVKRKRKETQEVIIVNIGTDRSTGDSVGPMVGTLLEKVKLKKIKVFGTIDEPIHALNVAEKVAEIKKRNPKAFFIGIDATISSEDVGSIIIQEGPVRPGSAFKKELIEVGDICIKPIVTNISNEISLSSVRLSLVFKMAKEIKEAIKKLDYYLYKKEKEKTLFKEVAATVNKD